MQQENVIKVITKDGEFIYSKAKWNLAWLIVFVTGCASGVIILLTYQTIH